MLGVSAWGSGVVGGSAYTDSKGKTQLSGSPLCQSWRALMLATTASLFPRLVLWSQLFMYSHVELDVAGEDKRVFEHFLHA